MWLGAYSCPRAWVYRWFSRRYALHAGSGMVDVIVVGCCGREGRSLVMEGKMCWWCMGVGGGLAKVVIVGNIGEKGIAIALC